MKAIFALAMKDLKLLFRDKSGFFFTFIFPIAYAIFFGSILGGGGSPGSKDNAIKVAIVDEDRTVESAAFAKVLHSATELNCSDAKTVDVAEDAVRAGSIVGFIRLMPGYGQGQNQLFGGGEKSRIEIGTDPSKKAEVGMLEGLLQKYAFQGLSTMFTDPSAGRKQVDAARARLGSFAKEEDRKVFGDFFKSLDQFYDGLDRASSKSENTDKKGNGFDMSPAVITSRSIAARRNDNLPPNGFSLAFSQGIIWGLMGAAMGFATSFVLERTGGTYARLRVSPLSSSAVLAGKGLACMLSMVGLTAVMLIVASFIGVDISHVPQILMISLSTCAAFVGAMMFIAALSKTERQASGSGWAVMMVFAFIGGAAIPSFVFPPFIAKLSVFSPIFWALRGFEGALWRGFSIEQMLTPVGILLAVALLLFGSGVVIMRRTES